MLVAPGLVGDLELPQTSNIPLRPLSFATGIYISARPPPVLFLGSAALGWSTALVGRMARYHRYRRCLVSSGDQRRISGLSQMVDCAGFAWAFEGVMRGPTRQVDVSLLAAVGARLLPPTMSGAERYAFFFCPSLAANGLLCVDINYKCWVFSDNAVWWELRRVVRPILDKVDLELAKTMKCNLGVFENISRYLGFSWLSAFMPSRKSAEAQGNADLIASPKLRQEAAVSTRGIFVILLVWSFCRHKVQERQKSVLSLEAWLTRVGPGEFLNEPLQSWCDDEAAGLCPDRRPADQFCVHLARRFNKQQVSSWKQFVAFLHQAVVDASACMSCARLLQKVIIPLS